MNNFIFENKTKVYFGKGGVKEYLGCLLKQYGPTVMLAYGGGSIKKNGVYDEVMGILNAQGKTVIEFSGIMPNPTYKGEHIMSILFINGSPNKHGNTASLAAALLKGKEYTTLNLTDYTIGAYGQQLPGDGLDTVIAAMEKANTIVVGSPVYWHNICGSVRNVLDRFYGRMQNGGLSGRKLYFVFQGAAPEKWMLEAGEYTMKRFAALYGMSYEGMATNKAEAEKLNKTL